MTTRSRYGALSWFVTLLLSSGVWMGGKSRRSPAALYHLLGSCRGFHDKQAQLCF